MEAFCIDAFYVWGSKQCVILHLHLIIQWLESTTISFISIFVSSATCLTLSWRRPLSYRNQSIDLLSKWFLYDNGLRHERDKNKPKWSFFRQAYRRRLNQRRQRRIVGGTARFLIHICGHFTFHIKEICPHDSMLF